ncbi:MAG: hypothetical protein ACI86S_000929 [Paracoccaceae bacterium]|jgi:hypothetical protein
MTDAQCGFVFATSGADYTVLARRAARTIRKVMPETAIDLFTDQMVTDPIFSQVHLLEKQGFHRPKMEAMRRTRFKKTVLLDADVLILAEVNELFEILEHVDIAAALGVNKTKDFLPKLHGLPRSVPVYNTGVIAFRKRPEIGSLARAWQAEIVAKKLKTDQGTFRKLIWESDLRMLPLPYEYNFMKLNFLWEWNLHMGAPRILHAASLHQKPPGDPATAYTLDEVLPAQLVRHVETLLASEWKLQGDHAVPPGRTPGQRNRMPRGRLHKAKTFVRSLRTKMFDQKV